MIIYTVHDDIHNTYTYIYIYIYTETEALEQIALGDLGAIWGLGFGGEPSPMVDLPYENHGKTMGMEEKNAKIMGTSSDV